LEVGRSDVSMVGVEEFQDLPGGAGDISRVFVIECFDVVFIDGLDEEVF
jgi:hypothetical protein